jgi:phage recombination protein Bet
MTPETQTRKTQGAEAFATTAIAVRPSLTSQMAAQYGVEPAKFLQTMKATVMPKRQGGEAVQVSDEDLMAFCMVAHEYGLNPFLKEIHAFPNKSGGITPMVGVDGWAKLMNRRPEFDGIEFEATDDAESGKPFSVTARIYIKGRSRAVSVTEYYSECQRGTDPWRQMPRRMLRHKALIQAVRVAFGFAGIHDEDEALDIVEATPKAPRNVTPKQPLFKAPAPVPQVQDTPQDEPQGDEQPVEADNAGLNSPDPIRRADLQAVEDVKEANYAKIATELDAKRQLIGDGFTDAGITFDQFRQWILEAR